MIREATRADVGPVTHALGQAFEDDPVAGWFWSDARRRRDTLAGWYRLVLEAHYLEHGRVFLAEDEGEIAGCSIWSPPGSWRLSSRAELRASRYALPRLGRRVPLAMLGMRRIERGHPTEPHWYLSALGVRPASQGQGLGSRLMSEILELCDRDTLPAYLESSTERSLALYERHGFETVDVLQMPRGGPPLWLMWRASRTR